LNDLRAQDVVDDPGDLRRQRLRIAAPHGTMQQDADLGAQLAAVERDR
jgi:hypothetical protein